MLLATTVECCLPTLSLNLFKGALEKDIFNPLYVTNFEFPTVSTRLQCSAPATHNAPPLKFQNTVLRTFTYVWPIGVQSWITSSNPSLSMRKRPTFRLFFPHTKSVVIKREVVMIP